MIGNFYLWVFYTLFVAYFNQSYEFDKNANSILIDWSKNALSIKIV